MKMRASTLGIVLMAGLLALGCVTPNANEREHRQRQARSHYDLGVDHLANGRTELALGELLAAEEILPKDPWVQLWLAEAYRRKERLVEAEAHLLRSLKLQPGFQEAQLNLSALYIQLERYQEACQHAQALWEDPTFPGPWRALTNLGWAEFKLRRYEAARGHLEKAVETNDRYWPALLDLGILDAEQGRRLEALHRFQQALDAQPPQTASDEVNYRMAELYVALGHRARALDHFRAAAGGDAKARWAQESQRYLKLLR
jgi:type IV pilus assembly protein PilF